jgi:hypothetical protein
MAYRRRRPHAPILALALLASVLPAGALATPGPGASPAGSAAPIGLIPEDTAITIGSPDMSLVGRLPLVIAEARGYLRDAGFVEVRVVEVEEPLAGLLNGSLDLAILDARQAMDAHALGLPVQAVAGHRVAAVTDLPAGSPGPSAATSPEPSSGASSASASPLPTSPWVALDLVLATTDTVSTRPGTVAAFTMAYIRALQDLGTRFAGIGPGASPGAPASAMPTGPASASDPSVSPDGSGDPILDAAAAAGLEVTPELLATWPAPLGAFLPFDGGFDDPAIGDGLGSLRNLYLGDLEAVPDLPSFVATGTLHPPQQALSLAPNPPDGRAVSPSSSPAPSMAVIP